MPATGKNAFFASFEPRHDAFVAIDSDGCVFNSMEIKQKDCFHPCIIREWKLEPIADLVRETAEFVNLYSVWRGRNRFVSLLRTFDLLRARPEVAASGVSVPAGTALRRLLETHASLDNAALGGAVSATGDPELAAVLKWSLAVNDAVARRMDRIRPFAGARRGLRCIAARADAVCVSQTPREALVREWRASGLDVHVALIAGQEQGTKTEQLQAATRGRYPPGRILLIGDAPGDLDAAREAGAGFYPIEPGREAASWRRFCEDRFDRFLHGGYAGACERAATAAFLARLPAQPPFPLRPGATGTPRRGA